MTAPSIERIDTKRLSPQSRWTLENLAMPLRVEDAELDDLVATHDLTRRIGKRMLDVLDAEIRAQQFGAELPPLAKQELVALEEQLRRWGQIYPVVRAVRRGKVLCIADGENREALLLSLGIPVEYKDVPVDNEEEARQLGLALNLARRQLDGRKVRDLVSAEILHDPSRSNRFIAELIGVSDMTVGRARRELEKRGVVEHSAARVGRDGVVQQRVAPRPGAPRREEKLTAYLGQLRDLAKSEDRAIAHIRADALIIEVLKLLGVEAIAETFEKVCKRS